MRRILGGRLDRFSPRQIFMHFFQLCDVRMFIITCNLPCPRPRHALSSH